MREAEFRQAIGDRAAPPPHRRMWIYRRNVDGALGNALAVRYPAVAALLGRPAFLAVARRYAAEHLPESPVLIGYGAAFPDALADQPPSHLADVARLDSAWWRAYHAAEVAALDPRRLEALTAARLGALRFIFHPSASLVVSRWAVGAIWQAARAGQTADVTAAEERQSFVVWRPAAQVEVRMIDEARRRFLSLLLDRRPLAEAVEAAVAAAATFDLAAELQMLLGSGLLTDFILEDAP